MVVFPFSIHLLDRDCCSWQREWSQKEPWEKHFFNTIYPISSFIAQSDDEMMSVASGSVRTSLLLLREVTCWSFSRRSFECLVINMLHWYALYDIICTAYPSPWWVLAGAPTNCILHTIEGNSFVILFSFTWIGGMSLSLLLVLQDIIENSFKLRYKTFVNEKWELILHVHDETLTSNPSHSHHVNLTLFIHCLEKIWRQWIWKRYPLTKRVFLDFAILVSLNNGWKTIMNDVGARL